MACDATIAEFVYNADGLRVQKTVNGVTTNYTLHGKNIVHMTKGNAELHFWYDAQNRPAIVEFNSTKYGYLYNLQGDVIGLIDGANNEVVKYTYDAWGKLLSVTGSLANTIGYYNPFRYRGYVYDVETGLYYLRSRYYNPRWGRFVNADGLLWEVAYPLLLNIYSYCNNYPVGNKDASGKSSVSAYGPYLMEMAMLDGPYPFMDIIAVTCGAILYTYDLTSQIIDSIQTRKRISAQQAIIKADARVRELVREDSEDRYWSATIRIGYVDIGRPLTFTQAVRMVASGGNVFTVTQAEAKAVARAAGGRKGDNNKPLFPEIDSRSENALGYYYHYHPQNHGRGHVFFLFGLE